MKIKQKYSKGLKINKKLLKWFNTAPADEILGIKREAPENLVRIKRTEEYEKLGQEIYDFLVS